MDREADRDEYRDGTGYGDGASQVPQWQAVHMGSTVCCLRLPLCCHRSPEHVLFMQPGSLLTSSSIRVSRFFLAALRMASVFLLATGSSGSLSV